MAKFILMLTRDDVTVSNALDLYDAVRGTAIQYVGFKDVGLDRRTMVELVARIHSDGKEAVIEVVSLDEEAELRSARAATELGADLLIGGTRPQALRDLVADRPVRYLPYVGQVSGHPGVLSGSVSEIVSDVDRLNGIVDGVTLLAFRHKVEDGLRLIAELVASTPLPVICAGSIKSLTQVGAVCSAGAWGFTIGKAALDCSLVAGGLSDQVDAILITAAAAAADSDRPADD